MGLVVPPGCTLGLDGSVHADLRLWPGFRIDSRVILLLDFFSYTALGHAGTFVFWKSLSGLLEEMAHYTVALGSRRA